jgi:hypothetical protein
MDNLLRDDVEERQARLERMILEYDRRRLVECGIKLRTRTDVAPGHGTASRAAALPLTIT